jgi:hypothetical protein
VDEDRLARWLEAAAAAIEVEAPGAEVRDAVLDLARDVAHNVTRPGAPLTAFLLGVAVGRGADPLLTRQVLSELAIGASEGDG